MISLRISPPLTTTRELSSKGKTGFILSAKQCHYLPPNLYASAGFLPIKADALQQAQARTVPNLRYKARKVIRSEVFSVVFVNHIIDQIQHIFCLSSGSLPLIGDSWKHGCF